MMTIWINQSQGHGEGSARVRDYYVKLMEKIECWTEDNVVSFKKSIEQKDVDIARLVVRVVKEYESVTLKAHNELLKEYKGVI